MSQPKWTDEDIRIGLQALDIDPEHMAEVVVDAGVQASGDAAADIRALADQWGLEIDGVLYALTSPDSPLFRQGDGFWE